MTDPATDAEITRRLAQLDQMNAGAVELAKTLATQYLIYRQAGVPKSYAAAWVETYLETVIADECVEESE